MDLETWIVVENGEMFEGTREQFMDCFFSNADDDTIKDWCFDNDWSLKIGEEVIFPSKENVVEDVADASDRYSIGDKYELFYNPNNPNNKKFEIRGIIDNSVIIIKSSNGNYKLENIEWLDYNIEKGNIKKKL